MFKDFECCGFNVKFENGTIFTDRNYINLFHITNEPKIRRFVTTDKSNLLVNGNRLPDFHRYTRFCIYVQCA